MINLGTWQVVETVLKQQDSDEDVPAYVAKISRQTSLYETELRELWDRFKQAPSRANAIALADVMKSRAATMWPNALADILGVESLTKQQVKVLEQALTEHFGFIDTSLLPDVTRMFDDQGILSGASFDKFDHRSVFMYAGALWSLGFLATVMFDGLETRDLADVFMFVGPDDAVTCQGDRGCAQFANKMFTVADILSRDIIPGHLQCLTNCRHMLWPIASPLEEKKKGGVGSGNFGHAGIPGHVGGSALSSLGVVLSGLYELAGDSEHRRNLVKDATKTLLELEREGALDNARSIKIVGSFVSDKEKPGDIDILVLTGQADRAGQLMARTETFAERVSGENKTTSVYFVEHGALPGKIMDDWFSENTRTKYGVSPVEVWQDSATWTKSESRLKGGTGSGNFGHSGRPGKKGGSGPGDNTPGYAFVAGKTAETWFNEQAALSEQWKQEVLSQDRPRSEMTDEQLKGYLDRMGNHRRLILDETMDIIINRRPNSLSTRDSQLELLNRVMVHDKDKYNADIAEAYVGTFKIDRKVYEGAFTTAMSAHHERNDHHYEFWVKGGKASEMSQPALWEMMADWRGTAREHGTPYGAYYKKYSKYMDLHPRTREAVEFELKKLK